MWRASGHVEHFTDALVECRSCHRRFKADELGANCPHCGASDFTEARQFNTMFKTFVGPVEDDASVAYLRPETCQMMYLNFRNVQLAARMKLPFGIAQIGKAFRNEITPGNFIFRTREFEQMELEYFVKPDTAAEWFDRWVEEALGVVRAVRDTARLAGAVRGSRGRAGALLATHRGYQVPVSLWAGGVGRHCQPRRLRPAAAHRGQREGA